MKYRFKYIAEQLIEKCKHAGMHPRIWHYATTGSVYIRFDLKKMRSVRIGDHDGREVYRYKYNLRFDLEKNMFYRDLDNGIERFYYAFDRMDQLVDDLAKRHATLLERGATAKWEK